MIHYKVQRDVLLEGGALSECVNLRLSIIVKVENPLSRVDLGTPLGGRETIKA